MTKTGRREEEEEEEAAGGRLGRKEKQRHHGRESSPGGRKRKHHRNRSPQRSRSPHPYDSWGGSSKRRKKKEGRSESTHPRRGENERRRSRSRSRGRKRHSDSQRERSKKAKEPPQVSYNAFDYFSNDIASEKLLPSYIMEEKNKYEKDVFEKAYGLSLGDDMVQVDQFLFNPNEGHKEKAQMKKTDSGAKHTSSKGGHYECYSCKAKNVYANVQCCKCKKLRKI
ncbi:hypothetical protein AK88_02470 [Plasmodium fragile]|uniref:RanBP2-type domain-containing protein n=1 Tax=Plasmodium fragile TaxID=5857 RepID=A0A0D9QQ97_PLAFR|nr:uncharacterized protein AK88_02470 [Plasmodium fragile]KJP87866.1 hypothetical protein AK88_02470 [Plasmodium fragile]